MLVRSVRPGEFDACVDVLARAFPNTSREFFYRYFHGDPWFRPEYTRVVKVDGNIVSLVQIIRREVRVGCSMLIMGGIANVGTPPEYRGHGYSTAAMESAIDVMSADGMDFSMLFTGIHPFYERLGWARCEFPHGVARLRSRLPRIISRYEIRPYRDDDAGTVTDIYNRFNSCRSLTVVRTVDYWQDFASKHDAADFDLWISVAECDGKIFGYVVGDRFKGSHGIAEIGCRPGHEESLPALASEVWMRAKAARARELFYRLPDEEVVRSAINTISVPMSPRVYTSMMLRVINFRSVFDRIRSELERRSIGLKGGGMLTLSTDFGEVTLDIAPGRVKAIDKASEASVQLTQQELFALIFGLSDPGEVLRGRPEAGLLSGLFPRQPAVFYVADSF